MEEEQVDLLSRKFIVTHVPSLRRWSMVDGGDGDGSRDLK